MKRKEWSRSETILAFDLYCKIPFAKISKHNQDIINIAISLQRTPSAVAMKMCNFASFDPELQARGVKGLKNTSKLDKQIWDEFNQNWEALGDSLMEARQSYSIELPHIKAIAENLKFPIGTTKKGVVKYRVNQSFFRQAVLAAYENSCCITGINVPMLLIASHIKPWRESNPSTERTNPRNGLCLNALHDKAFDLGLITITPAFQLLLSNKLKEQYSSKIIHNYFLQYEGKKITSPHRFTPLESMLEYHNCNIFKE